MAEREYKSKRRRRAWHFPIADLLDSAEQGKSKRLSREGQKKGAHVSDWQLSFW
jgi:hypothetical protein